MPKLNAMQQTVPSGKFIVIYAYIKKWKDIKQPNFMCQKTLKRRTN